MELIQFKCPNCSGSVVFDDNKDKAFCNYCGAELHFQQEIEKVQKEHQNELDALSDRITDLIEDSKFLQAEKAIQDGLLQCPYAGRLHLYMLMCELNLNDPELLGQTGKDYTTYVTYKKCLRYMTTEDKKDLLMLVEKNAKFLNQINNNSNKNISKVEENNVAKNSSSVLKVGDCKSENNKVNDLDAAKIDRRIWVKTLLTSNEFSSIDKLKIVTINPINRFNYVESLMKYFVNIEYYCYEDSREAYIDDLECDFKDLLFDRDLQLDGLRKILKEIDTHGFYSKEEKLLIKKAQIIDLVLMYYDEMNKIGGYQDLKSIEEYDGFLEGLEVIFSKNYEIISNIGIILNDMDEDEVIHYIDTNDIEGYIELQYDSFGDIMRDIQNEAKIYFEAPCKWLKAGFSKKVLDQELQEIKIIKENNNSQISNIEKKDEEIINTVLSKKYINISLITLAVSVILFTISLIVKLNFTSYIGTAMLYLASIFSIICGIIVRVITNKTITKEGSRIVLGQQKSNINASEKVQIFRALPKVKKVNRLNIFCFISMLTIGVSSYLLVYILEYLKRVSL